MGFVFVCFNCFCVILFTFYEADMDLDTTDDWKGKEGINILKCAFILTSFNVAEIASFLQIQVWDCMSKNSQLGL